MTPIMRALWAKNARGFTKFEKPYPMTVRIFRLPSLSETKPLIAISKATPNSAVPSIMPISPFVACKNLSKNMGSSGSIISVEKSVKKLFAPRATMFLFSMSYSSFDAHRTYHCTAQGVSKYLLR
jgi:hypothetical protein